MKLGKTNFFIDCEGKTIEQKRILWDILEKNGYGDCCIEDGMFSEGSGWYNANCFLFDGTMFHPRDNAYRKIITYDDFMTKHCRMSWRERYEGKNDE